MLYHKGFVHFSGENNIKSGDNQQDYTKQSIKSDIYGLVENFRHFLGNPKQVTKNLKETHKKKGTLHLNLATWSG